MPVEVRWNRNETHIVNLLNCYMLALAKITAATSQTVNIASYYATCCIGIRVWSRTVAGVETEVTAGTPVAVCTFNAGDFQVTRSNTWSCPLHGMNCTDNVVVRYYRQWGCAGAWTQIGTCVFSTEVLNASQLDAVQWTVYYTCSYAATVFPFRSSLTFHWDGAHNSRITNFSWTECVAVVADILMDGFVFIE